MKKEITYELIQLNGKHNSHDDFMAECNAIDLHVDNLEEENAALAKRWADLMDFVASEKDKDNNEGNHMGFYTLEDVEDKMRELEGGEG